MSGLCKLTFFLITFLVVCAALPGTTDAFHPVPNIGGRVILKQESAAAESMMDCWESLLELRSCTGEMLLFFFNGLKYLGPSCCHEINYVEYRCWPNMLISLGFTPEENDILLGYCDASKNNMNVTAPPPPKIRH